MCVARIKFKQTVSEMVLTTLFITFSEKGVEKGVGPGKRVSELILGGKEERIRGDGAQDMSIPVCRVRPLHGDHTILGWSRTLRRKQEWVEHDFTCLFQLPRPPKGRCF